MRESPARLGVHNHISSHSMEFNINNITQELIEQFNGLKPTGEYTYGVVSNEAYDDDQDQIEYAKYVGIGLSIDYSCCDKEHREDIGKLLCSLGEILSQLKAKEDARDNVEGTV